MATSTNGLRTPDLTPNPPNVPVDLAILTSDIDAYYGGKVTDETALLALTGNFPGRRVLITSTKEVAIYTGAGWDGYLKTYTPTLAGLAGAASAEYVRVGKLVKVRFLITASGAASGAITISLPSTATESPTWGVGQAAATDGGVATTRRGLTVHLPSTTTAGFLLDSAAGTATLTTGVPWTWASTDTIAGTFEYHEA